MIDLAQVSWTPERVAYGYYQQSLELPPFNRAAASVNFGDVYRLKLKVSKLGIYRCEHSAGRETQVFEMPDFSSPFQPKDTARIVLEQEMRRYVKEATDSPYLIAPSHGIARRQQMGLPEAPLCTTKRLLSTRKHFPGIHSTYAYVSSGPSFTPTHKEDFGLQSVNILYRGCPKIWVVIAPRHSYILEANLVKKDFHCSQSVRHLNVMPAPSTLEEWGIDFKVVMQHPGDLIGTDYNVYHYVWNLGPNMAEAVNFCGAKWFPPPAYVQCEPSSCPGDIHISVKDMKIGRPRHLDVIEDDVAASADARDEMMDDEGDTENARERQVQTETPHRDVEALDAGEAIDNEDEAIVNERALDNSENQADEEVDSSSSPSAFTSSPSSSSSSSLFSPIHSSSEEEEDQEQGENEKVGREESQRRHIQEQGLEEGMPDGSFYNDDEALQSVNGSLGDSGCHMVDVDRRATVEDSPDDDDLPDMSMIRRKHIQMPSRIGLQSSRHEENACSNPGTSENVLSSLEVRDCQTRLNKLTALSPQSKLDHEEQLTGHIIDLDTIEPPSQNVNDFDSGLGEELNIMSSPEKPQSYLLMQSSTAETLVHEVLPYLELFEWPSGDSGPGTEEALMSLCKENWLNDRIIFEVLLKLTSDVDCVRFIDPCYLRHRFKTSDLSVLPSLEGCRLLLAPFWVGSHWFLISVDFDRSRMVCHDADSRRDEIEYMQKAIELEKNLEIVWDLVETDKTIPTDGNNCGVYLLAQAQNTIDESFCPTQDPAELRLHFSKMLLGPTIRRLEMQTNQYPSSAQHQPTTSHKRPRLFFDVPDGLRNQVDIVEMVYAVGSPAVFADLAVVIQSSVAESFSDMRPVEMAMQSYTTAGAGMVVSKIIRIHACMVVQERFTELATRHRHRLQVDKRVRRNLRRQGSEVSKVNTTGKDARHLALVDLVSEWQGVPSSKVQNEPNYAKQRRAVEEAKKIGQHCLDLQKLWEDQPLWPLIPQRPVRTVTSSSLIDADNYKRLSREEAQFFIKELKTRRPLFCQNIQNLSTRLLRCMQQRRDAPRVKLHSLDPDSLRTQQIDSEVLLHCLDDTETWED